MSVFRVCVVVLSVLLTTSLSAQDQDDRGDVVRDVLKQVVLDPTTYAPSIVAWEATRLDWRSSQILFQNGWLEHNSRFTVSGREDDQPIGYAAGNHRILADAFVNLQLPAINNASERIIERVLVAQHPTHRKLLRTLGWIERSAMSAYVAYLLSADHFEQWQDNKRLARQLGSR